VGTLATYPIALGLDIMPDHPLLLGHEFLAMPRVICAPWASGSLARVTKAVVLTVARRRSVWVN
jgi:phosphoglycerate dehydrogenase-like enzyme